MPYIKSIIDNLENSKTLLTTQQKLDLEDLQAAYQSQKIQSKVFRQKFKDDGNLGETSIHDVNSI